MRSYAWHADVMRRLRAFLHTMPLAAVHRGDQLRDESLQHYDALLLALFTLDIVIDSMGFEDEASPQRVKDALEPMLVEMDQAAGVVPSSERHQEIVKRVLGALRGDRDSRRPFVEEYLALDGSGSATRRQMEFRLLSDAHHPSGEIVLRASNEACNLYLRLLDIDVEDAHAAAEAVIESQLHRGRFNEAVHSARQARTQSMRFREHVARVLRETRRDVGRVDWREEVPRLLQSAREHLVRRLHVEESILATASAHEAVLTAEDHEARRALFEVGELVRECRVRHVELHGDLMGARNVFFEAQARQEFAPHVESMPDLPADVLEPILRMPLRDADQIMVRGASWFVGARAPELASLATLIPALLRPRRPANPASVESLEPDVAPLSDEIMRFPDDLRRRATALLDGISDEMPLSELLAAVADDDEVESLRELIVLLALQSFSSDDSPGAVAVEALTGTPLVADGFFGDDLVLAPLEEAAVDEQ